MTPDQRTRLTPQQQAQQIAQYGPPPAHFTSTVMSSYAAAPPARRKSHRGLWITLGVVAFIVILAAANSGKKAAPATINAPASVAIVQAVGAPAPPAAPAGPATTVGDGTYQVGVDMAAGRYKTVAQGSSCYWERPKDDSGQFESIISNDNIQGPGSVTVKNGEFFKTSGGCTWTKQ